MAHNRTGRNGDLEIQITRTEIGKVPLKDIFGREGTSQDDLLIFKLNLSNVNAIKKVEFRTWSGSGIGISRDFATLADDFGNNYRRTDFTFSTSKPIGAVDRSASIYPNKSVTEVLLFEVPIDKATHLVLELPAENYGGVGIVRFRIPMKSVSTKSE